MKSVTFEYPILTKMYNYTLQYSSVHFNTFLYDYIFLNVRRFLFEKEK